MSWLDNYETDDDYYADERDEARTERDRTYDDRISAKEWAIQEGCSRDGQHYREDN